MFASKDLGDGCGMSLRTAEDELVPDSDSSVQLALVPESAPRTLTVKRTTLKKKPLRSDLKSGDLADPFSR